jgi:hypothetical protein
LLTISESDAQVLSGFLTNDIRQISPITLPAEGPHDEVGVDTDQR